MRQISRKRIISLDRYCVSIKYLQQCRIINVTHCCDMRSASPFQRQKQTPADGTLLTNTVM